LGFWQASEITQARASSGAITVTRRKTSWAAGRLPREQQGRARYIGLLGSRRKTILVERMLRDEGVAEERIRSVRAPIGLDLGGRTPAEIALSILAELSAERYGGSGRPLRLSSEIYDRAVAQGSGAD